MDCPTPVELNNCHHDDIIPFNQKFFCRKCGIYMPEDGSPAVKTKQMSFPGYLNPIQNLKRQWTRAVPIGILPTEYQKQRPTLIEYLIEWSEKLKLSGNSLFLAAQFLDYFMSTKKVDPIQYKLYGATSLMLAAKSIELDERIPFISKLRRYTYLPYGTLDFRRCECQLIHQLNWNLQCTTILDWAESAFSLGIVFEGDEPEQDVLKEKNTNVMNPKTEMMKEHIDALFKKPTTTENNGKSLVLCEKVQAQLVKLCQAILKDGTYLDRDPAELTVSIVACVRKACGFKNSLPPTIAKLFDQIQPAFADAFTEQFMKPISQKVPFGRSLTADNDYFSLQNYIKNKPLYQY